MKHFWKRLKQWLKGGAPESVPPLDPAAAERIGAALEGCMTRDKAYLDPRLDLMALSRMIGTNRTYLSRYINGTIRLSFSEYLNGFRVDEARRILREPDSRSLPMEEVARRCGFGSVSSMNRAFRRAEGISPAKYREIL